MNNSKKLAQEILEENLITPSFIRIKILDTLIRKKGHLSIEDVYLIIKEDIPSLSKTSIYNNMELFNEKKIIRKVDVGTRETLFEINTEEHAHFLCDECKEIYDVSLPNDDEDIKALKDFIIKDKRVVYTGTCKTCLNKN